MPRVVAVATVLAGAGVVFFGASYIRTGSSQPQATPGTPQLSLEPSDPDATQPPRDVVHGVVRTAEGEPAPRIMVDLVPLFSDDDVETRSTRTDEDGSFVFADVDVTPGTPFVVDAHFDGAKFPSEVLRLGRSVDDPLRLVVAPTTSSARNLVVTVESIALVGDETGVQAVHSLTIENSGSRAYTGKLKLPLLPGANAIQPGPTLDRRHLDLEHGSIVSSTPVPPGRRDFSYTYVAALPRDGIRFEHESRFPTKRLELLLAPTLAIDGPALRSAGDVTLGSRTYQRYEARDLRARHTAVYEVSARRGSPTIRNAGLVAAAVAAVLIVGYPLVRRRRSRTPAPPAHDAIEATP